jgi:hypothetical protein
MTATAVALVAVAAVLAGNPTKEKVARTTAGNAQAKAEIIVKKDLGSGWSGGATKPNLSSNMHCSSYKPKQSDLVLVGAAESTWQYPPFAVDSEAQVLRTPRMVRLDWQRTVTSPKVMPCLRQSLAKAAGPGAKLVLLHVLAFPHLATYTRAYRVVLRIPTSHGKATIDFEIVAFGAGRNELTLTVTGPATAKTSLHRMALRLGHRLAKRLHG